MIFWANSGRRTSACIA